MKKKWQVTKTNPVENEIVETFKCCFNANWVMFYEVTANADWLVAAFPVWQVVSVRLVI